MAISASRDVRSSFQSQRISSPAKGRDNSSTVNQTNRRERLAAQKKVADGLKYYAKA